MISLIPDAEYRALPGINISKLRNVAKSPRHFKIDSRKDSPAFDVGRAVDLLSLSGVDNIVEFDGIRRGKKWDEFQAANEGKIILKPVDYHQVKQMVESVRDNPTIKKALASPGVQIQPALTWDCYEMKCKGQPDVLTTDFIIDLKTTIDGSRSFEWSMEKYGYWHQAAWYQEGVRANTGKVLDFYIVAVEKSAPYLVSVWKLDNECLAEALQEALTWLRIVKSCERYNNWPGYSSSPIEVKRRKRLQEDEIEL